jgi:SAM-dependent methyltransferase
MDYSFPRYLASKKTVDDRALNLRVWNSFQRELDVIQAERPLEALEVGAGIGTMVQRMLETGVIRNGFYTAMDGMPENIAQAQVTLAQWAGKNNWLAEPAPGELRLKHGIDSVQVRLEVFDIDNFFKRYLGKKKWDALIANAFLDLFDVPMLLAKLKGLIRPSGLAYFSINFDGATILEPVNNPELEERILTQYHRTMDERIINQVRSGDSRAGRHLFQNLKNEGFELLDAGSSDWVVCSHHGFYPADEAYFLHHIIHFVETSLHGLPEIVPAELFGWAELRHAQVERGELVYIAHQMDFLARAPE